MRTAAFALASLALASGVCGCTAKPRSFADQCGVVRSRFAGRARLLSESPPARRNQSWEATSSYEFDSDRQKTLVIVRGLIPKEYQIVREAGDELNYVHTEGGDSTYVTVQLSAVEGTKTHVALTVKSFPS